MSTSCKHRIPVWAVLVVSMALAGTVPAGTAPEDTEWPREIKVPEATIVLYQPQLETFEGDTLTARAAISVTRAGETAPVFGAVWLSAQVATDRDERTVSLVSLDVPEAKFPNATPEQLQNLAALLKREIPKWDLTMSLDRLLAMLDLVERKKAAAEKIESTPPKILFRTHPTVLVSIDGKPQLRPLGETGLMAVVNTPFFIVLEPKTATYYLKGGSAWLSAKDVMGPWQTAANVPESVVAAAAEGSGDQTEEVGDDGQPQILVATEPTEVIVTDGPAKYSPLGGTGLLYVSNTDANVFLEITSQKVFVLLAGRWYTAASFDGPWTHVLPDKLPASFGQIPRDSDKAAVLAHVAGTAEAKEAVLETEIPQTAAVPRDEAKVKVEYDGTPRFEPIQDTPMTYAVNTSYAVIQTGGSYYCCDNGVWYVAGAPVGPWAVCVLVPQVIYTIPPSCPIYSVKYVRVYHHTPTVVYVGYTPGYTGCYVYNGCVVYGTGYVYRGWVGRVYYPRPTTYGFRVRYNSHTGSWTFGFGARGPHGWIGVGYNSKYGWGAAGGYGWWGVGGYYHHHRYDGGKRTVNIDNSRNVTINRGDRNIYNRRPSQLPANRPGGRPGTGPGTRPGQLPATRPETRPGTLPATRPETRPGTLPTTRPETRPGTLPTTRPETRPGTLPTTRPETRPGTLPTTRPGTLPSARPETRPSAPSIGRNDVFADRDGNVVRRTQDGWQTRDRSGWSKPSPAPSPRTQEWNRDYQARQRGTERASSFQRSSGSSRSWSGGRSGGGRRR